jgi:hypothetical protein
MSNRDRIKTKATPEGTLNYTYDAHGNLLTLVSSNTNGASLAYTYDVLNRLSKVCDNRIAPNCGSWSSVGGRQRHKKLRRQARHLKPRLIRANPTA